MADMIKKILTTAVKSVEGKERVLEFTGSTETKDRGGEVIKADAWQTDRYVKNPVVQWAHDYQSPPIGKTLAITRKGTDTVFEIEFASKDTYEFADTIFKLCKGGFLNATSVGFIPIEFERGKKENDPNRTFTKVELLEISIVPVPSNPDALVTAREAGVITAKEFKGLVDDIRNAPIIDLTETPKPRVITQAEIKDEIDYLAILLKKAGIGEDNALGAMALAVELQRLSYPYWQFDTITLAINGKQLEFKRLVGDDTPVKITESKQPEDGNKESLREYLEQEIKRQFTEV